MKIGHVALVGRPNAGKSTLLNHLIGQKISITSRRPQTTRHSILGIKTDERAQIIYVDTPGLHASEKRAMNRYMNRTASSVLLGVDVVVWVLDQWSWQEENDLVLDKLKSAQCPVILAINKIDQCEDKAKLLPFLEEMAGRFSFAEIVPVSALRGVNLDRLEERIVELLPEGEAFYPDDQITDRSERFLAAEIIREKLIRSLGQEVPHALAVEIEQYKLEGGLVRIHAVIWVEREGQKVIVIGRQGEGLKKVGQRARSDLEKMLEKKVYLNLWVKVKDSWSDNEKALQSLGYRD
ncbi:GTPase Era [Methylococcus sp. EFPC2]|uniref:GTPase Era n=1 Tax=Methylococcus sp. EFPC2 TaxID=2812648 RepID=UPI0019674E81|nr:GTPase Era [Methylococcus sp. EFPC2]QSA98339.1 GTPase Era [Methylococcus sp. EFPC2]